MSFSDEYKAGYSGTFNPNVDTLSYSYQMGQNDRERKMRDGTYDSGSGGWAGAMGAGPVFFAVVVLMAIAAFLLAWITYPIAGILTGITFAVSAFFLERQGVNGVMQIFTLAVPCYIVFRFAMILEHKVAKLKLYRIFRQCWRMFAGTGLVHAFAGLLHSESAYPNGGAPLSAYLIDGILTAAAPFLFYLNSMRLDMKYEHMPIHFKWLDLVMAPIKNRFVPVVMADVLETGVLHVRHPKNDAAMATQVSAGRAILGDVNVPVGNIFQFKYGRRNRLWLGIGGLVLLFFFWGSAFGGNEGNGPGFVSQVVGLVGLAAAAVLFFWAFVPSASPDRFGGPFRFLDVFYIGENGAQGGVVRIQFNSASDERQFVSAVENGLKAMPRNEPGLPLDTLEPAPVPAA